MHIFGLRFLSSQALRLVVIRFVVFCFCLLLQRNTSRTHVLAFFFIQFSVQLAFSGWAHTSSHVYAVMLSMRWQGFFRSSDPGKAIPGVEGNQVTIRFRVKPNVTIRLTA